MKDIDLLNGLMKIELPILKPSRLLDETGIKVAFIPQEFDVDWDTMEVKKRGPWLSTFYGVSKDTDCEELAYKSFDEKCKWEDSNMEEYMSYIDELTKNKSP